MAVRAGAHRLFLEGPLAAVVLTLLHWIISALQVIPGCLSARLSEVQTLGE